MKHFKTIVCALAVVFFATPALAGVNQFEIWKHNRQQRSQTYVAPSQEEAPDPDAGTWKLEGFRNGLALIEGAPDPTFCGTVWLPHWNEAFQVWENLPHTICGEQE